jgi:hypothetical protein
MSAPKDAVYIRSVATALGRGPNNRNVIIIYLELNKNFLAICDNIFRLQRLGARFAVTDKWSQSIEAGPGRY